MKSYPNPLFGESEISAFGAGGRRRLFGRGAAEILNRVTKVTDHEKSILLPISEIWAS
jgi:hypothetical protein